MNDFLCICSIPNACINVLHSAGLLSWKTISTAPALTGGKIITSYEHFIPAIATTTPHDSTALTLGYRLDGHELPVTFPGVISRLGCLYLTSKATAAPCTTRCKYLCANQRLIATVTFAAPYDAATLSFGCGFNCSQPTVPHPASVNSSCSLQFGIRMVGILYDFLSAPKKHPFRMFFSRGFMFCTLGSKPRRAE